MRNLALIISNIFTYLLNPRIHIKYCQIFISLSESCQFNFLCLLLFKNVHTIIISELEEMYWRLHLENFYN